MSEIQFDRLRDIRDVLLKARYEPAYNIGSPQALDHLLVHLVAVIDAIISDVPSKAKQAEATAS